MKLELTLNEIGLLMTAMGNLPYAQVYELIEKVRKQTQEQIDAQKANAPAPSGDD